MIGESELIITPRGSVYHLDLRPEEIADTIITVGDPARVEQITKYFVNVEVVRKHREFVTHTGYLAGKRLTAISTGIGTDNIDIVLHELDALVNIDLDIREPKSELKSLKFIRIGTSGSMRHDVPVDTWVVSESAIGLDNLLNFYRMANTDEEKNLLHAFVNHVQKNELHFIPYMASASPKLVSLFEDRMTRGITVTCPGFYGPQGRMLRTQLTYPNLIQLLTSFEFGNTRLTNFEMETAGIYGLSRILGHEAVSLNAIVANRADKKFSTDHQETVERLIRFALERIVQ
ncbi:MAG: nucleoside phosphorylase [Chitinophagales bacterium]|nr:nucleoside phosphorylase [Chitinophagales bacterium]